MGAGGRVRRLAQTVSRSGSDGRILITDYKLGLVAGSDPAETGAVRRSIPISAAKKASRESDDLVIARNGDVYFTDQGQTGMQDP